LTTSFLASRAVELSLRLIRNNRPLTFHAGLPKIIGVREWPARQGKRHDQRPNSTPMNAKNRPAGERSASRRQEPSRRRERATDETVAERILDRKRGGKGVHDARWTFCSRVLVRRFIPKTASICAGSVKNSNLRRSQILAPAPEEKKPPRPSPPRLPETLKKIPKFHRGRDRQRSSSSKWASFE